MLVSAPETASAPTTIARPAGRRILIVYGLMGCLLGLYLLYLLFGRSDQYSSLIDGWSVTGFEIVASLLCLARGLSRRRGRIVPLALGAALLSWSIGDFALTAESLGGATPSTPSVAD